MHNICSARALFVKILSIPVIVIDIVSLSFSSQVVADSRGKIYKVESENMSREYADTKIKEALQLCDGNMARARQQILTLAQDDLTLLSAIVQPHLDGIIAYQVERVASGRAELEKRHPNEPLPEPGENFGMDLLRAVASSDVAVFGQDDTSFNRKRKTASKQHIDAIHKIAASTRNKKNK